MGGLISKHEPSSPYEENITDMEILEFDRQVHAKTMKILTRIGGATPEFEAPLSFSSLREVTECLLEMNQEVVKIILHCKKDIWNNKELFDLVEDYLDNSLRNLDFCSSLETCLKKARDNQLLILMALQHLEDSKGEAHIKALNELKNLNITDPFTEEFFQVFQSVYTHQLVMLQKLRSKKTRLDKKLRFIQTWRRVCGATFVVTIAAVLICAVVAAAIAAPPVAAALSAATSIPLGSVGKWVDSLWNNCESVLKGQKEVVSSMQAGAFVVIQDMDNIRSLIGRLEVEMESLIPQDCIVDDGEEVVMPSIEDIKKKLGVFMSDIECLSVHAYTCSRDIRRARTVVLQRIIKHPQEMDLFTD